MTNNRSKIYSKETLHLLENSLEKVKMHKSELRKNIVNLLIENEKLKNEYKNDTKQYKLTIHNLEKELEEKNKEFTQICKELAEKTKEFNQICKELESYEFYEMPDEVVTEYRKKILLKIILVFLCGVWLYNTALTILIGYLIV